jgi:AcrR family transcriptional regulator
MRESQTAEARPYHHGDLRRALIDAARRLLEAEGPSALSLRAVAREAGVSPAAPYHHFKDKGELLEAVAQVGWEMLDAVIGKAKADARSPADALDEIGVG